jgi:hypothetical protein
MGDRYFHSQYLFCETLRLFDSYARISHKSRDRNPHNPYLQYVLGIFNGLFFDAVRKPGI